MTRKVFDGIKVADFAWVGVGPMTSKYLADHGATVVRIESHKRPETLRALGPYAGGKPGINRSMYYGKYNSGKFSVSIDLSNPKGVELAWKMIMWADIMTESFTPKAMKNWGLEYESVRKVRPDIIYFSSCGQGHYGPNCMYPAHGTQLVGLTGLADITGWPDRPPSPPFEAYTDLIAPRFNSTAIIAALEYRRRTGRGQWIDGSQVENSVHFISPPVMDYVINGKIATRNGNRHPYAAPHGVFPCKGVDRWVAIAVSTDKEWQDFCNVASHPEWSTDPRFTTLLARKENEDELERLIEEWTSKQTAEQVEATLQATGVPASMVEKNSDVFEDPQLKHRGYFVRLDHPVMGNVTYDVQACYILSKTPREIVRPSPCLGEHNEYVFKELLGLTDEEIADYIIEGGITTEV